MEDLEEINPLPELTKSLRQKQKTKSSQNVDSVLILYPIVYSTVETKCYIF